QTDQDPEIKNERDTVRTKPASSNFLSENAGLLIGGAAVAGGGYLYYSKQQRKKEEAKKWEKYDAELASNSSASGSNSNSNRKLLIRTNVASAVVGVTLPAVEVAVVDNGNNTIANQD